MANTPRERPVPWAEYRKTLLHGWELSIFAVMYVVEWILFYFGRWGLLRILEYSSFLSVMFAVLVYFNEAPDRKKQKHYQAWQVINTAQGKSGSGGRNLAMEELNADKIPLVGVDVSRAALQALRLPNANLLRANLEAADLRDCVFDGAHLEVSNLLNANLRNAKLRGVHLRDSSLEGTDLFGADLTGADISYSTLKEADLRYADLKDLKWEGIVSVESTNIYGVKNPPAGFEQWALAHGAISKEQD